MFSNIREMWQQASAEARLGLAIGAFLIVAALVYFSSSVMRAEYQTLFSDLDAQDAVLVSGARAVGLHVSAELAQAGRSRLHVGARR